MTSLGSAGCLGYCPHASSRVDCNTGRCGETPAGKRRSTATRPCTALESLRAQPVHLQLYPSAIERRLCAAAEFPQEIGSCDIHEII